MSDSKRSRYRRLLIGIVLVLLLGAVSFYAFNMLIWKIPAPGGTRDMALADLDGDGDLDAFLANGRNEYPEPNTVLWNDGQGNFSDGGQRLGNFESEAVLLHDFDSDGDVDALVSNGSWGEYFYNDGSGIFSRGQSANMPTTEGYPIGLWRFAVAELDGDGISDLFLAGCCGGGYSPGPDDWHTLNSYNTIWLGTAGTLTPTGVQFGRGSTAAVALADLDGDGNVDAFGANNIFIDPAGEPVVDANSVWFNDGHGNFDDTGQRLGERHSFAVALGDLDGDGDLDAVVGNAGPDEVWLNDGRGTFTDSGQALGDGRTRFVYLDDFDSDGDRDALLADERQAALWFNDGLGSFRYSGQRLRYRGEYGVAVGDVDGDGAPDVVAGRLEQTAVWINDGAGGMRRR